MSGLLRFAHAVEQRIKTAVKRRRRVEFGDEVVIVGVEPLGHLHRRLRRIAAGQREVLLQTECAGIEAEARGQCAEQRGGIEQVVVQGEVADRGKAQSGISLLGPVRGSQLRRGGLQLRSRTLALPEIFEGELQFALRADAWVAQDVRGGHAVTPR